MYNDTERIAPGAEPLLSLPSKPWRLAVLVPGLGSRIEQWASLRARLAIEDDFGDGNVVWLNFEESTGIVIPPLEALATRLRGRVDAEWAKHGEFNDVVLIGHSLGGLVARQAYLQAAGAVRGEPGSEWASHVSRIVLFASINRGVDLARIPLGNFFVWVTRKILFFPHFWMMDVIRGSNFLTNLRINWIRHFGRLVKGQEASECWPDGRLKRPPLVVQLLGEQDGVVSPDDSKDVLAFPSGHYLLVPDANHRNLHRFDQARDLEGRYAILRRAFVEDFADNPTKQSAVRRVVFLLHGIRASNIDTWIEELKKLVIERDGEHTAVRHPTYGYFTAARFALPSVRRKNITKFQDWYTEALAECPTAEFNIIAHSNGTYILGQSLRHTPGMHFVNVILAGSVLPTHFPWDQLKGQVGRVRNDRANRDWPVALLCNALRGLCMWDIGTGGFAGFEGDETLEVAYYNGDHGEVLRPVYQAALVDFIFGGDLVRPKNLANSPGFYRQLSNAMPYFAVLLVMAILTGMGCLIFQNGEFHPYWLLSSVLAIIVVYALLDIL
ncbi:MAG: Alpha/beta hydrolase family protein [Planctomycetaceae bacterium]|nr:Alpha/beta hydrolase family protein [Planctomycetaceae bacterium]